MKVLGRNEVAMLLVWAFRDQRVETSANPHEDARTLYCNVMALPVPEAATLVAHARSANVPPTEPVALARWTRGVTLLRDMLAQPMCALSVIQTESRNASVAA